MLLAGRQERHLTCKNWIVGCWHSYLSGVRCKWFACGPANATATPSSLASLKSRMVLPYRCRLTQVVLEKRPLNVCSVVVVFLTGVASQHKLSCCRKTVVEVSTIFSCSSTSQCKLLIHAWLVSRGLCLWGVVQWMHTWMLHGRCSMLSSLIHQLNSRLIVGQARTHPAWLTRLLAWRDRGTWLTGRVQTVTRLSFSQHTSDMRQLQLQL